MSAVTLRSLTKRYGSAETLAVDDLSLDIAEGEFVTLLGPSGCGKTTTLRCLAGLEIPTSGEIEIGGRTVFSYESSQFVPPEKRAIGMVFQSYALWPHMTVAQTVGYPLKLARTPSSERRQRVDEMLERVHLQARADDLAVSLSGGQQQRVALARAMANRSSLVLFDEPLSNLDVKLRHSMRTQIRELHDDLGTTSVYVTHDQEEAIALADRVVVMNAGQIEQVGTPRELYANPRNAFVADFMGFQNILPARVVTISAKTAVVELDDIGARIEMVMQNEHAPGDRVLVAFRASHVEIVPDDSPSEGVIAGRIRHITYLGMSLRVLVDTARGPVRAQIDERDFGRYSTDDLRTGREIALAISPSQLVGLPSPGDADHSDPVSSTVTTRVPA
ncbi:spermidine/putrescine ABC transporter ATP-binding protein [Microbacterium faecale]|uniref:Spermidine/putrescine ABC transporter ATP-binding protein n=1 Tax=Microbacterium faecale TaxID=1804630 RepID=A0A916Y322_9MICO|nr:ABC transporter ATP-binding protein [Microbacterium faecale]GGD29069.1 spermidine/putrescine ABC transporter ATP-binding protein [Microbacterium faecale]